MVKNIETVFKEAFKEVSESSKELAPDVLLRLYAYYKQATNGDGLSIDQEETDVRDAFKFNAWMQLKGMSETEAMSEYVKLVNEIFK